MNFSTSHLPQEVTIALTPETDFFHDKIRLLSFFHVHLSLLD